jgi:hypothetical protein
MDWKELLENAIEASSQAAVARKIGYSASAVNQVLQDKYQGNTKRVAAKVVEIYGNEIVSCPVLGDIPLGRCALERQMEFSTANPTRVELWDACQTCDKNAF